MVDYALWMKPGTGSPDGGYNPSYLGSSGDGSAVKENTLIRQGQLWRLAMAPLLHGSFGHLLFNCLTLYFSSSANGQRIKVNCNEALRNPSKDLPVYPNDQIEVPRRFW